MSRWPEPVPAEVHDERSQVSLRRLYRHVANPRSLSGKPGAALQPAAPAVEGVGEVAGFGLQLSGFVGTPSLQTKEQSQQRAEVLFDSSEPRPRADRILVERCDQPKPESRSPLFSSPLSIPFAMR